MAPALTEPLSPTENLTSSAVKASTIPTTRSSRKIESTISTKKVGTNTPKTFIAKSAPPVLRSRSGGITNQTPTSSKRLTRLRNNIHRNSLSQHNSLAGDNITESQKLPATKRISKITSNQEVDSSVSSSINNSCLDTKNEQMGLSTALLNNNKILNNVNDSNNTSQNLCTIDDNTKDSSTAQLLADLTNEAITAEICLRNQLKDVNLVKTSGDPSYPITEQHTFVDTDTDIVVLKSKSPSKGTASEINKITEAHMEAQFIESKSSKILDTASTEKREESISTLTPTREEDSINKEYDDNIKQAHSQKREEVGDKCQHADSKHKKENVFEAVATEHYMEASAYSETSVGSSHSLEDSSEAKKTVSKLEIISVQELPPVSTDSTMTASEAEDNLEERLSQLDGTAIDSPPPNNHDMDSKEKSNQNFVADESPLHTRTHQQTLSIDIQELQQQLQQTPPTPISQQVESNHLELTQHQSQETNCFSAPQSNLLGNVSGNISQSYIKEPDTVGVGAANDLEDQDIEEVFKVLKGFEGGTTSDLNVCDLNVLFNEVYMKINETELGGNAGSGGSVVSGISTNTQSHVIAANPSIQMVKPTKMEDGQREIEKRQQQMQRKIDFLLRRLRKLQARYMCKHTSEEIAGLFEWTARQSSKGVTNTSSLHHNESTDTPDPSKYFLKVIAARPPASDWKDVHESLVPANQISSLLRKIESVASAQQLCTTPSTSLISMTHKKSKKALVDAAVAAAKNSSSMSASMFNESKAEEVVIATLEENITDELSQVAGLLQSEMCEVQKAIDSDATESSSGGESADEMVTYNNTQQQTLPITKRAAWRYSRDRAAIASRWSWLLSQISDLEIKIRQHSELNQEIIRSKGPVTCSNQLDTKNATEEQINEEVTGSCRTRGYLPSMFRKRKLIQTTNIHTISKKAARPSTIKCGCQWPLHPCALCTGRMDPTAPRDLPDTMMMSDRIALLDSGYHPALSFRENVNNALHFEAIAKQPEWQQRVMRCQAKNIAKNVWRAEREAIAAAAGGHHTSSKKYGEAPPTKRRYIKKKDRLINDEKYGRKNSNSLQHAVILPTAPLTSTTSVNDVGNGTSTLSTTTSTTPLMANKGMVKGAKKQHCPLGRETLKDPSNSLLSSKCLTTTMLTPTTSATVTTTANRKYIHQTSVCRQTNYDQFNPNQTPLSSISNNHNSTKSYKHRQLSSSTVINSHYYNHPNSSNNNLYNGDSSYEYWGGAGENFNVRSRTSSPIHGSSGNVYHKYERSLDRKNRISYDIDNIVIPYSVAAATRVEVLPYKEIPTPKWRVIYDDNEEVNCKEPELKLSSEDKTIVNGHICNDHVINSINKEKESMNCATSCMAEVLEGECNAQINDNAKTSNEDTVENESYMATTTSLKSTKKDEYVEEKLNKNQMSSDNKKEEEVDETIKEPELKKRKIKYTVKNKTLKQESEKESNEEKMTLQTESKLSLDEDEDISDDAMFLRHEKALTEERRKFQTYLKFPWSTRSRANRRIDSRAESSGANTPDPSSPAPQTPSLGGGDLESIPSPLNPATPLNPIDTISEAGDYSTSFLGVNPLPSHSSKRYERRRTTSTKRDREIERRSSTPDSKEIIPPYEPFTFPLTDDQFEELMRVMPSDHGEESKRFDECYLPSTSGMTGIAGFPFNKYPRTVSSSTSKRSSRSSTLCGDVTTAHAGTVGRRVKTSNSKNLRPVSADDSNIDDMLLYDDYYEDDYPKHHLAPNDDHLTADSVCVGNVTVNNGLYVDEDDVYGNQYSAYVGRQQRKHRGDSEEDSSEEEPFQDDDPNDPEWRGESEDRLRKKV